MTRKTFLFLLVILLIPSTAAAFELPGSPADLKFDQDLADLDLELADTFELTFKTGGTSIGFKIRKIGKRNKFVFLPENTSTRLEGEVAYYRLSRLLGLSDYFNPVGYYEIGPRVIAEFKDMLRDESNRHRKKNTKSIRARIEEDPNTLLGVIKFRSKRDSQGVKALIRSNRFRSGTNFADFIRGDGVQPTVARISIPGVRREKRKHPKPRASEVSLARQLSTIFVFDMLLGQWDRFSGGNIEAYAFKDGGMQFIGRDNGGSHLSWGDKWFDRYAKWLTRFDRKLVADLRQLDRFLNGEAREFRGMHSPDTFEKALGLRSASSFEKFKGKLHRFVAEHVASAEDRFGADAYFIDHP